MIYLHKNTLQKIAGFIMLAIGVMLLRKGLILLVSFLDPKHQQFLFMSTLANLAYLSAESLVVLAIFVSLVIGYAKGRFVIARSVMRSIEHIQALPEKASLFQMYSTRVLVLMAFMITLGVVLNVFAVPNDVRGMIDVAVGAALIQSAALFFRVWPKTVT